MTRVPLFTLPILDGSHELTVRPAPPPEAHVLLVRITVVQDSRETAYDMILRTHA